MKLSANLEFRKAEKKTFKGNDGKEQEMLMVIFLTEEDEVLKVTPIKTCEVNFSNLVKGKSYTVFLETFNMQLTSNNDLATMYQVKFKIENVLPFEVKGGSK